MTTAKMFFISLSALLALAFVQFPSSRAAEKDGGFVVYPGASASSGPIVFSHKAHGSQKAGYACTQCHASASPKALDVTMADIRQGKDCGACHDGKTKGPHGQKAAPSIQDCSACHMPAADIVIHLNRMDPVAFSHIRHLKADTKKKASNASGFSCSDCHRGVIDRDSNDPVGMEVPHETGGCAQCHDGKKRVDGMPAAFAATTRCLTCHKPPA
jgi:c(7)-type cytochrome triheme protein